METSQWPGGVSPNGFEVWQDTVVPILIGRKRLVLRAARVLWKTFGCLPLGLFRKRVLPNLFHPHCVSRTLPFDDGENVVRFLVDLAEEHAPYLTVLYVDPEDPYGLLRERRQELEPYFVLVELPARDDAESLRLCLRQAFPFGTVPSCS